MKRDRLVLHMHVAQVEKLHRLHCHRQKLSTDFFSLQNAKGKLSDSCAKYSNTACHEKTRLATNHLDLICNCYEQIVN